MTEKVESSKKRKKKAKKKKRKFSLVGVSGDSLIPGSMFDRIFIQEGGDSIQSAEIVIDGDELVIRSCNKHGKTVEARRRNVSLSSLIPSREDGKQLFSAH